MSGLFGKSYRKHYMDTKEKFMPVKEYAEIKSIPLSTVYKMIKDKTIKSKKIGSYTLVSA